MPTRSAAIEIMYRGRSSIVMNGHLVRGSCSMAAGRACRKDVGSVCSRTLRARPRTPRGGALQRPSECETCGWGRSSEQRLSWVFVWLPLQLLEQLALALPQLLRHVHADAREHVAAAGAPQL